MIRRLWLPAIATAGAVIIPALAAAANEAIIYSFKGTPDGGFPISNLNYENGDLVGATYIGGNTACDGNVGCGTLFQFTLDGTEKIIHAFKSAPKQEGPAPNGAVRVNGDFYGTTCCGGSHNTGTVFKLSPEGAHTELHVFGDRPGDGSTPYGNLTYAHGRLFGTTLYGGANGRGTVFSIKPDGAEKILHSFGAPGDGAGPSAGLILVRGVLYGTTGGGGSSNKGTVFSITPAGVETVLYSFQGGADGVFPQSSLLSTGDALLGTTYYGGTRKCGGTGCGTVFRVTLAGTESILHVFVGGPDDGVLPQTGLVTAGDSYYGTTSLGGMSGSCQGSGTSCGTVFQITKSGIFSLLHRFPDQRSDGQYPVGNLASVGGRLYGLTEQGGAYGLGSLFSITP